MKDKIKTPKPIDDDTTLWTDKELKDLTQCPYCYALFPIASKHYCKLGYICSICAIDIRKKSKESLSPMGHKWVSFSFKKYFKVADKIICWNCAFNIVRLWKKENK